MHLFDPESVVDPQKLSVDLERIGEKFEAGEGSHRGGIGPGALDVEIGAEHEWGCADPSVRGESILTDPDSRPVTSMGNPSPGEMSAEVEGFVLEFGDPRECTDGPDIRALELEIEIELGGRDQRVDGSLGMEVDRGAVGREGEPGQAGGRGRGCLGGERRDAGVGEPQNPGELIGGRDLGLRPEIEAAQAGDLGDSPRTGEVHPAELKSPDRVRRASG